MQHVGAPSVIDVFIENKSFITSNGSVLTALKDTQFGLAEHSFTVLFGPSGCGKTTLLRLLAGLDDDFKGSIDWPFPAKVGFVFQEPRLLPWRSVRDNVMLRADPEFTGQNFSDLMGVMGLEELLDHYPSELSLGLARRVAIARALATRPNLLLLDEPFVSLDEPTAVLLRRLVRDLWVDRPITAVMVTHDIREAIELGEELLLFSKRPGRVCGRVSVARDEKLNAESIEAKRLAIKAEFPELFEG